MTLLNYALIIVNKFLTKMNEIIIIKIICEDRKYFSFNIILSFITKFLFILNIILFV